jgi:uncharacterized membrane protein YfcA
MTMPVWPLLPFVAGVAGGAMNALAGGGTFATMPALIGMGLSANVANATSNFALLPGAATSAHAFRHELADIGSVRIRTLTAITFAGGLAGAALLAWTPTRLFDMIVPWLLLFATVVLAAGPRAADWLRARVIIRPRALLVAQGLLGIYGGYFGGGIGMVMTALYGLLAGLTPRAMFAPRTLMLTVANGAAAIVFMLVGLIAWAAALPMLAGGMIGGWLGARIGKRLKPIQIRVWTLTVSAATTLVFFLRAYG